MCVCVCVFERERGRERDNVAVGYHTRMPLRLFAVKCWAASEFRKATSDGAKAGSNSREKWNFSVDHCCVREVTALNASLLISQEHQMDSVWSRNVDST